MIADDSLYMFALQKDSLSDREMNINQPMSLLLRYVRINTRHACNAVKMAFGVGIIRLRVASGRRPRASGYQDWSLIRLDLNTLNLLPKTLSSLYAEINLLLKLHHHKHFLSLRTMAEAIQPSHLNPSDLGTKE